ncbi:nucleotidyltransferase domain-containing protein [Phormidium sp. CCY1219]|uniref:nucleotidyltransferase domain-containing protein n=1 Tax=Phormidium sp. CCY1219 TaxID=2886104 RepID=UPI002D1F53D5|nr:nucleotidyltransferase domain-containing protein [Phormidium sp. CCY1219]MEB3829593.1 nucleotidyltransferase domain-containing protein [Phormidium sp. CCY1219]
MTVNSQLLEIISHQPYPLLFSTLSGAHLFGFPSQDSDYDLRGVHILPLAEVVGLHPLRETIEHFETPDNQLIIDLVTHDIKKFFQLLLTKKGVLEPLYSPLVFHSSPEHEELKSIARSCITRHHAHHYLGFARTQWRLFEKEHPPRVKPLLYVFRVLLTGIHLMQTGEVEANLVRLNEAFQLRYIPELIARKMEGGEGAILEAVDVEFYRGECDRLRGELDAAFHSSCLPEAAKGKDALNDLLVRVRLKYVTSL